jgi:PadR family transcriptional regulator PadR
MDLLVLAVVGYEEAYGYRVARLLEDSGLKDVSEATVYTSLRRLESKHLLESRRELADNGRARKYYALTAGGVAALSDSADKWHSLSQSVDKVLSNFPVKEP